MVVGGSVGMCWCVCVLCVVCADSRQSFPQEKWSSAASSGKANDWRTRERVVLDLFSNLESVRSKGFFR